MFLLLAQDNATIPELRNLDQYNQPGGGYTNVGIGDALAANAPTVSFDLGLTISRAAQLGLMVASILMFVLLVFGGMQWMMSSGDKGKVEAARSTIMHALIGLAITASAFAIFQVIQYFFGLNIVSTG